MAVFLYILGFIFYAVSRAKTDLYNKYDLTLCLAHFLKQDHLLNLIVLGGYANRWPKYARFSKQKLM